VVLRSAALRAGSRRRLGRGDGRVAGGLRRRNDVVRRGRVHGVALLGSGCVDRRSVDGVAVHGAARGLGAGSRGRRCGCVHRGRCVHRVALLRRRGVHWVAVLRRRSGRLGSVDRVALLLRRSGRVLGSLSGVLRSLGGVLGSAGGLDWVSLRVDWARSVVLVRRVHLFAYQSLSYTSQTSHDLQE
jgi:hypothetical protein